MNVASETTHDEYVGQSLDQSELMGWVSLCVTQDSAACGWMALRRDLLRVLKSALDKNNNCFTWRHAH